MVCVHAGGFGSVDADSWTMKILDYHEQAFVVPRG